MSSVAKRIDTSGINARKSGNGQKQLVIMLM